MTEAATTTENNYNSHRQQQCRSNTTSIDTAIAFGLFFCPIVYTVTRRQQQRRRLSLESARRTEQEAERGESARLPLKNVIFYAYPY